MGFASSQFVRVARQLLTDPDGDQPALRTAAGRAYYALYGTVRSRIVAEHGDCFGKYGMHGPTIRACTACQDAQLNELGKLLEWLEKLRVKADYRYNETVSRRDVLAAVLKAEAGLVIVGSIESSSLRPIFEHLDRSQRKR